MHKHIKTKPNRIEKLTKRGCLHIVTCTFNGVTSSSYCYGLDRQLEMTVMLGGYQHMRVKNLPMLISCWGETTAFHEQTF